MGLDLFACIIGQRRYLELAMTNRKLTADEAADWDWSIMLFPIIN